MIQMDLVVQKRLGFKGRKIWENRILLGTEEEAISEMIVRLGQRLNELKAANSDEQSGLQLPEPDDIGCK